MFANGITPPKNPSKPYSRVVHLRQRLAQLTCRDPKQEDSVVYQIGQYIENHFEPEVIPYIGKNTFASVCRKLGLKAKIATHWMSLRKELLMFPFIDKDDLPRQLLNNVTMRYYCISQAFLHTLKKQTPSDRSPLKRNNVINLNYVMIQLFRLEGEQWFQVLAKFLPQLISFHQPRLNNERWKILIEYCREHYPMVEDPIRGTCYRFFWDFLELTEQDIIKHFFYFV